METVRRWSLLAFPIDSKRTALHLPDKWTTQASLEKIDKISEKCTAFLSQPFILEIEEALKTDKNMWFMGRCARWTAERLVLFLYDFDGTMNIQLLKKYHLEARRLRNEFLRLHPHLPGVEAELDARDPRNPNGSIDIWQALLAFNAYLFEQIEAHNFAEECKLEDPASSDASVASNASNASINIASWRSIFAHALRVREHAAIAVLLQCEKILEENRRGFTMSYTTIRKYGADNPSFKPKSPTPLLQIIFVTRLITTFMVGARNNLRDRDFWGLAKILKMVHVWASTRQASLLTLSAIEIDKGRTFLNAVHNFEMAVMTEYWAFSHFVEALDEEPHDDKFLESQVLLLNLSLSDDRFAFKDLSEDQKTKVREVFQDLPAEILQISHAVFITMWFIAKAEGNVAPEHRQDSMYQVCSLLSPTALLAWKIQVQNKCPQIVEIAMHAKEWNLAFDMPLQTLLEQMKKESAIREKIGIGEAPLRDFDHLKGMPFSMHTLSELVKA